VSFPIGRALLSIQQTPVLLQALLRDVDQARASQARDGEGWNVVEVLCHLNDYEQIFSERIQSASGENPPSMAAYNPDEMAVEKRYAEQSLTATLEQLLERRRALVAFLKGLAPEEWEARAGIHPAIGKLTITEQVLIIPLHDVNHMEQMIRALGLGEKF